MGGVPAIVTILLTLIGVALIALVLRDIFLSVFSPGSSGTLSTTAVRYVWRAFRWTSRRHPDRLGLAGPVSLVLIIVVWLLGLILGWAFIYWPHLPEAFLLSPGVVPERNAGFLDAVYVSMVTLGTLGYGEIAPQTTWLRLLAPLQALIGFATFTAAISWILSIYPSLARRRYLACQASLLARHAARTGRPITALRAEADSDLLLDLVRQVVAVRDDLVRYRVTYYFRNADHASALELALPTLLALARDATKHEAPAMRTDGVLLQEALNDLATYLDKTWLDCGPEVSINEVLEAYAADHLRRLDNGDAVEGGTPP